MRREPPRLPTSVSNLATKYEPTLRPVTVSPTEDRRRLSLDSSIRSSLPERATLTPSRASQNGQTDELSLRRQRIAELEEIEYREQQYELRLRERERKRVRVGLHGPPARHLGRRRVGQAGGERPDVLAEEELRGRVEGEARDEVLGRRSADAKR